MHNIEKALDYLESQATYNKTAYDLSKKGREELSYLLNVVSNRQTKGDPKRNKFQRTLDYIWQHKMCSALDVQEYANTTDPRKFINMLMHNGIISPETQWWKPRNGGASFKVYYLANVREEDIDFEKCTLKGNGRCGTQ